MLLLLHLVRPYAVTSRIAVECILPTTSSPTASFFLFSPDRSPSPGCVLRKPEARTGGGRLIIGTGRNEITINVVRYFLSRILHTTHRGLQTPNEPKRMLANKVGETVPALVPARSHRCRHQHRRRRMWESFAKRNAVDAVCRLEGLSL